jgi:hypothetical protein
VFIVILVIMAMPIVAAPCVVLVVLVAQLVVVAVRGRGVDGEKIVSREIFLSSFQTPNHMTLFILNSSSYRFPHQRPCTFFYNLFLFSNLLSIIGSLRQHDGMRELG